MFLSFGFVYTYRVFFRIWDMFGFVCEFLVRERVCWQVLALLCLGLFHHEKLVFSWVLALKTAFSHFHGHICNQRVEVRRYSKFQSGRRYLAFGSLSYRNRLL